MEDALIIIRGFLEEKGYQFTWVGNRYLSSLWSPPKRVRRSMTARFWNNAVILELYLEESKQGYKHGYLADNESISLSDPDAFERILAFVEKHW